MSCYNSLLTEKEGEKIMDKWIFLKTEDGHILLHSFATEEKALAWMRTYWEREMSNYMANGFDLRTSECWCKEKEAQIVLENGGFVQIFLPSFCESTES